MKKINKKAFFWVWGGHYVAARTLSRRWQKSTELVSSPLNLRRRSSCWMMIAEMAKRCVFGCSPNTTLFSVPAASAPLALAGVPALWGGRVNGELAAVLEAFHARVFPEFNPAPDGFRQSLVSEEHRGSVGVHGRCITKYEGRCM